jgi:hypothetical protein
MSVEAFEKFKKSWLQEIAKIENRAIDSEGVHSIYLHFDRDRLWIQMHMMLESDLMRNFVAELDIIESKLIVALETARSRYRLENRGLWARIAEGIGGIIYRIPKSLKEKEGKT